MSDKIPMLSAGSKFVAKISAKCPKCQQPVELDVSITIQNMAPASMILWPHDNPSICKTCSTQVIPVIAAFDVNSIKWEISPVINEEMKPLIEAPGQIDISKIKLN